MSVVCSYALFGCVSHNEEGAQKPNAINNSSMFVKTEGVIPFDKELRRKWGAAVVADLDDNGWEDVITTQHGTNVLIYWNEGGHFSKPSVLIRGDTHGLGVSDYDGDGEMNIVVAQGGGDGGNPRRPVYFSISKNRTIKRLGTFDHFQASRGRSIKFLDANKDANLDIFATGFAPKNVKSLTTNQLYVNNGNEFTNPTTLTIAKDPLTMKALTTDVNNDGVMDVITFGGRVMTVSTGVGDGTFTNSTNEVLGDISKVQFVNNITELDYDNDGDFDLFLTRSAYQFEEEAYYDPVSNNLAFFAFRDKFMFDELIVEGDNLTIENVQETYATYDIQLGKKRKVVKTNKPDSHAGGTLVIKPEDAEGWPDGEELKGLHIGYLGEGKWRVGGYVKSRISGVINNVVSVPQEVKRKPLPAKLLENRQGKYIDVSAEMGINIPEQTTSAAAGDFNNDGFIDLAISPYGNMAHSVEHFVLINKGGKGFVKHENSGLISEEIGATGVGITTFDYDHDGKLDLVFGNERGRWYLAQNQLNSSEVGNFVTVKVGSSPLHNAQPIGARVTISACGTKQTQLVGASGDGFHHMLNTRMHFGIGECSSIDSAQVEWQNGEKKRANNIQPNVNVVM